MYSKKLEHTTEVIYCYSDVACPFRSYLAFHDSCLITGGVGEIVDSTVESEDESGSTRERGSKSTEESKEYEALPEKVKEVHCSKN